MYLNIKKNLYNIYYNWKFYCFQKIFQTNRKDISLKGVNYLCPIKANAIKTKSSSNEMEKFYICHHCKNLFKENYLLKCKYNSSLMGLPIMNKNTLELLALNSKNF